MSLVDLKGKKIKIFLLQERIVGKSDNRDFILDHTCKDLDFLPSVGVLEQVHQ